jgi:rubrerythrin
MDVFDCAIKMEEKAKVHYLRLAQAAATPEMEYLFTVLARAEQEHHDALVELKAGAVPTRTRFKALQEVTCLFQPLLARRELTAELKKSPDAYQRVISRELKGIEFYVELAAKAKDKESRELLLRIADEERRHLSIVENIYSFVESPRNFLVSGEFSNLKEY